LSLRLQRCWVFMTNEEGPRADSSLLCFFQIIFQHAVADLRLLSHPVKMYTQASTQTSNPTLGLPFLFFFFGTVQCIALYRGPAFDFLIPGSGPLVSWSSSLLLQCILRRPAGLLKLGCHFLAILWSPLVFTPFFISRARPPRQPPPCFSSYCTLPPA